MQTDTDEKIYSVTEISQKIQRAVQSISGSGIRVRGEVTNLSLSKAGHLYFDIKDENAGISAVLFRNSYSSISQSHNRIFLKMPKNTNGIILEQGKSVIVAGDLTTYPKASRYQILIDDIESKDDIGELHKRYLKLKEKLENAGYFDIIHKKPIPLYPKKIAILTSQSGAAIKDMEDVLKGMPLIEKRLFPVIVQGDKAAPDMIKKLRMINEKYYNEFDTIIIGRGGGSYEDLFCFNDEGLVMEIFNSKIPVISAIGHERDYTLSDFVADYRAITPTAAATAVINGYAAAFLNMRKLIRKIQMQMHNRLSVMRTRVGYLSGSKIRPLIKNRILSNLQYIDSLFYDRIEKSLSSFIHNKRIIIGFTYRQKIKDMILNNIFKIGHSRISAFSRVSSLMQSLVSKSRLLLNQSNPSHLKIMLNKGIMQKRERIFYNMSSIKNLSPGNILRKGYSITYDNRGGIIRDSCNTDTNQTIKTQLYRGSLKTVIIEINHKENIDEESRKKNKKRI